MTQALEVAGAGRVVVQGMEMMVVVVDLVVVAMVDVVVAAAMAVGMVEVDRVPALAQWPVWGGPRV